MKKKVSFLILSFIVFYSFSQEKLQVKFNMASAMVLMPNIGVEYRVSDKSSLQLEFFASFWDSFFGIPYKRLQVTVGYRYYVKSERSLGFFLGPNIGYGKYLVNNINSYPDYFYQKGKNLDLGLNLGYKVPIGGNKNFAIEFFVAGGWSTAKFKNYREGQDTPLQPVSGEEYEQSNKWRIHNMGVSLIYNIKSNSAFKNYRK